MNRRDFAKSLGALALTPALPLKAFAAAPTAVAVSPGLYKWSAMLARVHGQCSTGMLTSMLKVEPKVALGLYEKLLENGVVTPANALGLSRATNPMSSAIAPQNTQALQTTRRVPKLCLEDDEDQVSDISASPDGTDSPDINQELAVSSHEPTEPLSRDTAPKQPGDPA